MTTDTANTSTRVAIVTGAARGIGRAIAQRQAADGRAVALLDLDREAVTHAADEITAVTGQKVLGLAVDVSDDDAVGAAVTEITDRLGPPTVVVNNAGITRDNHLFKMTTGDWDAVMNVHLRGAFLVTRQTQGHMVDAGWGRIVNLSSTSALGNRGQVNYAAAKAGMQGFTKSLAIELGRFGVTANAVAPGFIETDMTRATADRVGVPFEQYRQSAAAQIPVRRAGRPEDIAAAVAYFTSDEASFVTGQVLYVAGGPKA